MPIHFTKMHGIENDYIYLDGVSDARVASLDDDRLQRLAIAMSDRHTGIGSDGLILILPAESEAPADVRMRMFNSDGSESEMCGNGIRCVAKFAHDRDLTRASPMRVQTGAGILSIDYALDDGGRVASATVDMGPPRFELETIPVNATALVWSRPPVHGIEAHGGEVWAGTFVSMGNPHAVFFDRDNDWMRGIDLAAFELDRLGPILERHAAFPRRANIHIVQAISRGEVRMRTWERGAGLTMACGTGACAVCAAGAALDITDREVLAHLPGGDLRVRWDELSGHIFMTGPATEVFQGVWPHDAS